MKRYGNRVVVNHVSIEVKQGEQVIGILHPEKRLYTAQNMPMTEAAIDRGVTRDLYVALGESLDAKTWILRVQHKPFVAWIWAGCLIMALGGWFAASDKRYRLKKTAKQAVELSGAQA